MFTNKNNKQNKLNKSVSVLQWNCNGVLQRQTELKNHLITNNNKYDVICLQETFLKPGKNFTVSGYNSIRLDRTDENKGGVLTLVRDNINYTQVNNNTDMEYIVVNINLNQSQLKIVNIYIPPGKDMDKNDLSTMFGPQTLIIGDLNAKSKIWGSPVTDERGLIWEDLLDMYNSTVINTGQPTYQHFNGTLSHLDVAIVSNSLAAHANWTVLNNTMGSDHCPTVVTLYNKETFVEEAGTPRFKLSKADWRHFKRICNDTVTVESTSADTIDWHNDRLTEAIRAAAERSIPQTGRGKGRYAPLPYWDDKCKAAIYQRNRARNKLNKNRTAENIENYHKLKGIAQRTVKEAASDHWKNFCATLNRTSNLSVVWNMAKKMNGTVSQHKVQNIVQNGNIVESDQDKANTFAESFAKISSNENYSNTFRTYKHQTETEYKPKDPSTNTTADKNTNTLNEHFNFSELRRALRESKTHSTPGEDKISYEMLKHLPRRSAKSLLHLYNTVWTSGTFPQAWRHSITVPLLKAGKDQKDIKSYRPVSLTSTIGKVMERLVTNRLSYYLEKNNILNNVQTGFRKGKSTIDQIIRLQDTINKYNHNRGYTVAVFIDFKSAYDMLWRHGLLTKISKMGITGNVYTYIQNFLTNRTMQVRVGNKFSDTHTLENGTPQGSVISPILFLLMINDLPDNIKQTDKTLFADDSCLFKSGKNLDSILRKMQDSLNKLTDWCDKNGFKISMEKTVAVLFTHRRDTVNKTLRIYGDYIKIENKAKFLGIIFDSKLTWSDHVNYIMDKCNKRLNLLRAVSGNKWGASKKTLLILYRSLIRSILDYGDIALDSMSDHNKRKLDSIQARALRVVCGAVAGTATSALQVDTGELPLQLRRLQHQLQYTVKVKSDNNHPADNVFKPNWLTIRHTRYDSNTDPIHNKVSDFSRKYLENIEVTNSSQPSVPPWHRKECIIDISISKSGNKKESPNLLTSLAKERLDTYSGNIQIFTDASKNQDGRTAAAYYIPGFQIKHATRLTDNLTIFTAELTAIKLAVLWLKENQNRLSKTQNIVIVSDSLSALKAIKTCKSMGSPSLLNEVLDLVDNIRVHVTFLWVPSHLGIHGNETVDRLAQNAAHSAETELNVHLEKADLYRIVDSYILQKWQDIWTASEHGKFYKKLEPSVSFSIKYQHTNRAKETTITRLRLGKCRLNDYLAMIKVLDSDKCTHCERFTETVEHFLIDCNCSPLVNAVKSACRSSNVTPSIENILSDESITNVIYRNINRKI